MSDDGFLFADERPAGPAPSIPDVAEEDRPAPWKVLIVDDDPEVHAVTRLTLSRLTFKDRGVTFLSAHSAAEGQAVLEAEDDVAVVLLDVVMETDDAGLRLARAIREDLHDKAVRIILRTGQPGQAPEQSVIVDYDINDYKAKTELTAQKLFTTVITALRSYEDIVTLEANRRGLQQIIETTDSLFRQQSLEQFAKGVLVQLASFMRAGPNGILCVQRDGPTDEAPCGRICVLAGVGRYEEAVSRPLVEGVCDAEVSEIITGAFATRDSVFGTRHSVLYIDVPDGPEVAAYVHSHRRLSELDRTLLEVFTSKVAIGFANVRLYEELRQANETLERRVAERTRDLEEANRRLALLASTDPLTGALNRRSFMEAAAREVDRARRYGHPLSVLMFDLDFFKRLNDTYGHVAGDHVLQAVVRICQEHLRGADVLGRYGGEEFAVLLPETDRDTAERAAERLRQAVADAVIAADGNDVRITMSVGVTALTAEETTIDGGLHRADDALYAAKHAGRNCVRTA